MDTSPKHIIIMGVSGSGKTSFGKELAKALSWHFIEGDDFHTAANKSKMSNGIPLKDEDRLPWLRSISNEITAYDKKSVSTITTCSALKHSYREILRTATCTSNVHIIHLHGCDKVIAERLAHRSGHFFPSNLLSSQIQSLEPLSDDESGMVLSVEYPLDKQISTVRHWVDQLTN